MPRPPESRHPEQPRYARPPRAVRTPGVAWALWALAGVGLVAAAGSLGGTPGPIAAPLLTLDAWVGAGWPALVLLVAAAGSLGGTPGPIAAPLLTLDAWVGAGWPALVLLAAAVGWGRLIARARIGIPARDLRAAAPAVGVASVLLAIVCLGTAGLLNTVTAWAIVLVGLIGFGFDLATQPRRRRVPPPPIWLWAGLPGIAVLAVAAASPPGVLWASEYGGYDALSYHLQLPKEWIELGDTHPVEHNVYSFLPGAIEQAFAAIGFLGGASRPGETGMLAGGGAPLIAAQVFHAGLTVLAAGMIAALARRLAIASGARTAGVAIASAAAGGLTLLTPWTVVVGSLAYNEMGVVLIGAGAVLIACRRGPTCARAAIPRAALVRSALVGALVGVACLCKPTALLFVGAPAGVLLLRFARLRDWPASVVAGSLAGALVLTVWLVRNAVITGNPVFPLATGVFGTGHWSAEQAARFAAAHRFEGGVLDRLRLLVLADPSVAEGANAVARYRGISNTQWLLAFPAAAAGIAAAVLAGRSRDIGVGLALCLAAQLVAWLAFTHLQSRFLVPCLIVLGPGLGVGLGVCARGRISTRIAVGVGVVVGLLQTSALWAIYAEQYGGEPGRALGVPPAVFMGEPYKPELGRVPPVAYLNHETPEDATVLLVGDATPLYHTRRTVYATVWDRPPVLDLAAGALPERPDFILVNDAELARQRESGYLHEDLTPAFLDGLVRTLTPVLAWPEIGVRLYRVPAGWTPDRVRDGSTDGATGGSTTREAP